MTPRTAAVAMSVVTPDITTSKRALAMKPAAPASVGSCRLSSSANTSAMEDHLPPREEVLVAPAEAGGRLDRVLAARIADLSRSRLKALILAGEVAIGG